MSSGHGARSPPDGSPSLEGELEERYRELKECGRRAEALVTELRPDQIWWRPEPERWSVGECLVHLRLTARAYLPDVDEAIRKGRTHRQFGTGPFQHGSLGSWFVRLMEPPPRWKLVTQPRLRPRLPAGVAPADLPDCLEPFLGTRTRLVRRLERARGLDLADVRAQCPASRLLRFTLGQIFAILTAHERRHLWQAERVLEHPEFPGS